MSAGGERVVVATEGCEAGAYQHEIDHLYGMLILDRVESLVTDVFPAQDLSLKHSFRG